MILKKFIPPVAHLLEQAAKSRETVRFAKLFACFPENTAQADVYDTMEAACADLAPWSVAIYSVVLAKKGNGLPGDGFFDIFRIHRRDEFAEISQGASTLRLTQEQKEQMVALEKARVYAHAQTR